MVSLNKNWNSQREQGGGCKTTKPSVGGARTISRITQFNKLDSFFYFLFPSTSYFHLLSARNCVAEHYV